MKNKESLVTLDKSRPLVEHIDCLNGLRGLAALLVFLSHARILCGLPKLPVISWGGLAVDLFMILSGFLMAHHYRLRQQHEPWMSPLTWVRFWVRRWFRLAPLYYLLLVVALVLGPWVGEHREAIASVWPSSSTPLQRYMDQSATNLILHLSFVFGMLPDYAFRTPLPDWSIGLEMQFYIAFPFLMMLGKHKPLLAGLAVFAACLMLGQLYGGFLRSFQMPSFLPIKLYIFLIGIWAALSRDGGGKGGMLTPLAISIAVCLGGLLIDRSGHAVGRLVLVIVFFYLMDDGSLPAFRAARRFFTGFRRLLATPVGKFAADTSYGLYLVHLLVLIPVAGWLANYPAYVNLPHALRYLICVLAAGSLSYAIAWVLFHAIEVRGIDAGKRILAGLLKYGPKLGRLVRRG